MFNPSEEDVVKKLEEIYEKLPEEKKKELDGILVDITELTKKFKNKELTLEEFLKEIKVITKTGE